MEKLKEEIHSESDLRDYFQDFELQVILREAFYLPVFLPHGNITSPKDICHYMSSPLNQILARLNRIYGSLPSFLGAKSKRDLSQNGEVICMDLRELMKSDYDKGAFLEQSIENQLPLIIFGTNASEVFSAAMYLCEEGVQVKGYFVIE